MCSSERELRDLLVKHVSTMYPLGTFVPDFRNLVETIKPGTFAAIVPVGPDVTIDNIVNVVVDRALREGWVAPIVAALPRNRATAADLDAIQAYLKEQPKPTSAVSGVSEGDKIGQPVHVDRVGEREGRRYWQVLVSILVVVIGAAAGIRYCSPHPSVVAGIVEDREKNAVKQAAVELIGVPGRDETDSSGKFLIPLQSAPAEVWIRFSKAGYETKDVRTTPRGDIVVSLDATMKPTVISGNVSDVSGAAIPGCRISIDEWPDVHENTTTTGNFRVTLPGGGPERVHLRVSKPGFEDFYDDVSVNNGGSITIQLERRR